MATNYSPNIVTDGLVCALDASDKVSHLSGSTTWADLSSKKNNGTLTNGPTFDSEVGGSIVFDGSNDLVDIGDIGDLFGTSFAVVMWFNTEDVDNRQEYIGQFQNSNNFWRWGNDELDNWEVDIQDNGTRTAEVNPDWSVVANEWVHVACSRNGASWNFYKNGEVDGTGNNSASVPDIAANVKIGNVTGAAFEGKIAAVQIYDRYLTTEEVRQNYNATKKRFGL